ncbi:afadin [Frankliniella occidentalis]|uniref:Afadin n=1 Tax=Frankliniella occidentalis TaxID=133901 RepID=A0A9C6U157_FRAOC|nr:afadin [Frankliniella occidentalis]
MDAAAKKAADREALRHVIQQWNANRLDIFELSEPNEELEFHGVMRFYFQDSGQKVATKCIRVASDATSQAVIETLIEKFRPDMRMLSIPEYALYEIHENGDERRLGTEEKPLLVQLNWHKDDREGRFLLRRINDKTNVSVTFQKMPANTFQEEGTSFKRKLSKREKKMLKKQEKQNRIKNNENEENPAGVAGKLYTELPETSFTRSISNPEAVMRRRRQQKLEKKLQQFRSKDGGPDTGGTLKIYGEALCKDVPYKTLLLSIGDSAAQVVREMLAKYGLDREDPHVYCLVQVNTNIPESSGDSKEYHGGTNNREYILDDDECPLAILMNHPNSRGSIMFHVRRRPADYHPRKRKKKPQQAGKWGKDGLEGMDGRYDDAYDRLPFFLELNPDGTDIMSASPQRHKLQLNVTEVGSERPVNGHQAAQSQCLTLHGPHVMPRHCVVAHTEGIVTVTPCSRDAETYVNGIRIYETTILQNGSTVKFGRLHNFRFIDPNFEDRNRQRLAHDYSYDRQSTREDPASPSGILNNTSIMPGGNSTQNYETTFDVDGNVETVSTSSLGNKDETRSQRSVCSSRDGNRLSHYERYPRGSDAILPAVLEFREETEEAFLHAIITDLDPNSVGLKLAPTYTLYLAARYRASTHYQPDLTPTERADRLTILLARVAAMIQNVIQERYSDSLSLAFWMANASELLHFLKSDRHVSAFSVDAQDILAEAVQLAFRNLVSCLQGELSAVMPSFMSERDDLQDEENGSVLQVLTNTMSLLRRCRVNAALTIQLFSQLFHFVNVWAFNCVVTSPSPASSVCYCSRAWGLRFKSRLAQLEVWAERQGLELAADCHLARIIQAAHLLQAPKYTADDLATISSTCFKLNSLQLRALLTKYQPAPDEPRLSAELVENVVRVAENVADELARTDGREVQLTEEPLLQLPFLLPEDGYSCDVVRGVPQGLADFLAPLSHAGLCRMTVQPTSSGMWTVYQMQDNNHPGARSPSAMSNRSSGFQPAMTQQPEYQVIKLHKSNNGMGLSIVAAKGAGQDRLGIYIKSVVKGGAADIDGQLQAGDQLLKVDGQSLVGITQEKAAEYLVRTGPVVTLEVAKQGAIYHGLATLLSQPSPVMGRASSRPSSPPVCSRAARLPISTSMGSLRPSYNERLPDWSKRPCPGPRRMSERDLPSRVLSEQNHNTSTLNGGRNILPPHAPIHSSKSVPSLNTGGHNDGPAIGGMGHGPMGPMSPISPIMGPGAGRPPHHEVFNPGYSRTSSTTSIPQGLRSRSSQNLTDARSPTGTAMPPMGLGSRQMSNPSLQPPQQPPQSQHSPNGHSVGPDGERFYQNLSIYRNQDMHNGYPPQSRGKLPSPQHPSGVPQPQQDRSPPHIQKNMQNMPNLRGSQSSLHRDRPASAYLPQNSPHTQMIPGMGGMQARSQSSRDMVRQDAKLAEMQEEVRRRELRQQQGPQPGQPIRPQMMSPLSPQQQQRLQGYPQAGPQVHPPPTAPKPGMGMPQRPPLPNEEGFRDSPPPPPPPTSTHPLYKTSPAVDSRYNASSEGAPRGNFYQPNTNNQGTLPGRHIQFNTASNPWDREEKEREQIRRREAARQWRDAQIAELSSMPSRSQQQEEQLRALRLEREFQRRAEEARQDDEEEDDQESPERNQGLLRLAQPPLPQQQQQQQHSPPQQQAQQSPPHNVQQQPTIQSPAHSRPYNQQNGIIGRTSVPPNEEKERQKRLEDMKRKQAEMEREREQQAEERLREAQKQEIRQQQHQQQLQQQQLQLQQQQRLANHPPQSILNSPSKNNVQFNNSINNINQQNNGTRPGQYTSPLTAKHPAAGHLRLENLVMNGPSTPQTPPQGYQQYNGYPNSPASYNHSNQNFHADATTPTSPTGGPQQRLDTLLHGSSPSDKTAFPPQPPERGSSYSIMMSQPNRQPPSSGPLSPSSSSGLQRSCLVSTPGDQTTSSTKRVSFHDPGSSQPPPPPSSQPPPIREDPNHFINEAETMLASPKTPDGPGGIFVGSTPGVIGAQEVYRDPRQRRLAEQQQQQQKQQTSRVPEKLTFKEKMKMFAMETGEDGTPRDKVKISRAQRDIDTIASPTANSS